MKIHKRLLVLGALSLSLLATGALAKEDKAAKQAEVVKSTEAAIAANKRDFDARFELAQIHFAKREFTQAMDALLEIIMVASSSRAGAI